MSINKIYSDQSRRVDWTVREDTDATLTLTVTQSSVAYDLSSTTFIAEFFEVGSSTAFLQLTQGSGLTNGGAAGTLTIALTDTQLNLTPNQYFWKLRTTAPTDYLWLNGIFQVNGYVWDGGTDYSVSVALTVANNEINIDLVAASVSAGGSGTVNSGTQYRLAHYATTGTAVSETSAITGSRALKSDANGLPTHFDTSTEPSMAELAHVKGLTSSAQTQLTARQLLVNSATALVDGATIDLTSIKHTLATSTGRTFTISYTGDDITLIITLSATSATFTFPATTLCVTNGTASGDNTMAFTGVVSGDKLVIAIKKVGSDYYAIGKNFGQ